MDVFTVRHWILLSCLVSLISAVKWPEGTYTLIKPKTGCPSGWMEGGRFQDNEDTNNKNNVSTGNHFFGISDITPKDLTSYYCTKVLYDYNAEGYWPNGNYCILRQGRICPSILHFTAFKTGVVTWDDENSQNANGAAGVLPSGIFDKDTSIDYCCRDDGVFNRTIRLPTSKPFYLLRYTSHCQWVEGMNVREEFIQTDDENDNNKDRALGSFPYAVSEYKADHKLVYCYYYPIQ